MPNSVLAVCDDCGKKMKLAEKFAGRRIKCPECGTAISVPGNDAVAEPLEDEFGEDEFVDDPKPKRRSRRESEPDDMWEEEERPRRRTRRREESFEDDYDDYEDERPSRRRSERSRRSKSSQGKRKSKRTPKKASSEGGAFNSGVLGGIGLMVLAAVWFVGGLMANRIFFYPPILFILGMGSVIKGLVSR